MKAVEFHYNVADKLAYSCRLLRKILASDLKVLVVGPAETLQALDAQLWALGPSEFVPHCHASAPAATLAASPIWLAEAPPAGAPHEVMLNLGAEVPPGFDQVQRYLEVVSTDPADVQAGRARWRHYQSRGIAIQRHDRQERA